MKVKSESLFEAWLIEIIGGLKCPGAAWLSQTYFSSSQISLLVSLFELKLFLTVLKIVMIYRVIVSFLHTVSCLDSTDIDSFPILLQAKS